MKIALLDEAATQAFAKKLAALCVDQLLLFFYGDLGAGKTTFIRAFLRAKGVTGHIKSPSFAIVEPYEVDGLALFHFDLYRISAAEELEYIGLRDYLEADAICLFEWAEKGERLLPGPDLSLSLSFLDQGRELEITARTELGEKILVQLGAQKSHG